MGLSNNFHELGGEVSSGENGTTNDSAELIVSNKRNCASNSDGMEKSWIEKANPKKRAIDFVDNPDLAIREVSSQGEASSPTNQSRKAGSQSVILHLDWLISF